MGTDAGPKFSGSVTVGERGQIVIPAELRRAFGIEPGEKLLILAHATDQTIMIVRADSMMRFLAQMQEAIAGAAVETPAEEGEEQ